jgi:hypothetical protein
LACLIVRFGNNMKGYHPSSFERSLSNIGLRIAQLLTKATGFPLQIDFESIFYGDILFPSERRR